MLRHGEGERERARADEQGSACHALILRLCSRRCAVRRPR
jgi:hypothetical protein